MLLWSDDVETPIGRLGLFVIPASGALCALDFGDDARYRKSLLGKRFGDVKLEAHRDPRGYSSLLREYFDGDMTALDRIPVDTGGTPFQRKVWAALRRLRAGETTSYGAMAVAVGSPSASRAVGLANGSNPVAIVVPCHRVIGANGTLTGYGGGLDRKRWLLEHERRHVGQSPELFDARAGAR